jgi:hypothetical protein
VDIVPIERDIVPIEMKIVPIEVDIVPIEGDVVPQNGNLTHKMETVPIVPFDMAGARDAAERRLPAGRYAGILPARTLARR